jgi:hypothetical protein
LRETQRRAFFGWGQGAVQNLLGRPGSYVASGLHPLNVTWNSKNEVWEDDFPAGFVFLLIGSNFHVKFLDRIKFEKELILEGVRFLEVAQNSPE